MERIQYFRIPYGGYLVHTTEETMPIQEVLLKVESDAAIYSSARKERDPSLVTLCQSAVECPECYQTFHIPPPENETPAEPKRQPDFHEWLRQTVLPGLNWGLEAFEFFSAPNKNDAVTCPHCGHIGRINNRALEYSLFSDQSYTVVVLTVGYNDRRALRGLGYREETLNYPLGVKLIFDHGRHRTYFQIADKNKSLIVERDITETIDPLRNLAMTGHIGTYTRLHKALVEAFAKLFDNGFPFRIEEVDLETLILANRFQGFPRNFYDAIPFSERSRDIDEEFAGIAKEMEHYRHTPALYEKMGLPGTKAIRRMIFLNPALLFYHREIMKLPFRDPNILLQILDSHDAYRLLSLLHALPGLQFFLRAMVHENGETSAWRLIAGMVDCLPDAAALYMLVPKARRKEILCLRQHRASLEYLVVQPTFNRPVCQEYQLEIPDRMIGRYYFMQLKNVSDYQRAAKYLHNCLEFRMDDRVIGIVKDHSFVGAIAVEGDSIIEAKLYMNEPIENDEAIFDAFLKWIRQNNLRYDAPAEEIDAPL